MHCSLHFLLIAYMDGSKFLHCSYCPRGLLKLLVLLMLLILPVLRKVLPGLAWPELWVGAPSSHWRYIYLNRKEKLQELKQYYQIYS